MKRNTKLLLGCVLALLVGVVAFQHLHAGPPKAVDANTVKAAKYAAFMSDLGQVATQLDNCAPVNKQNGTVPFDNRGVTCNLKLRDLAYTGFQLIMGEGKTNTTATAVLDAAIRGYINRQIALDKASAKVLAGQKRSTRPQQSEMSRLMHVRDASCYKTNLATDGSALYTTDIVAVASCYNQALPIVAIPATPDKPQPQSQKAGYAGAGVAGLMLLALGGFAVYMRRRHRTA